jgi:hypothetical protein
VFRDEVARARVERTCEEGGKYQVNESVAGGQFDKGDVKSYLCYDVEKVDPCERELIDHHWAKGVEEDLEGAEEGFAEDGVKKNRFEGGWKVCIQAIDTKRFMVRKVVGLSRKVSSFEVYMEFLTYPK